VVVRLRRSDGHRHSPRLRRPLGYGITSRAPWYTGDRKPDHDRRWRPGGRRRGDARWHPRWSHSPTRANTPVEGCPQSLGHRAATEHGPDPGACLAESEARSRQRC
jgi:hypothetical protein